MKIVDELQRVTGTRGRKTSTHPNGHYNMEFFDDDFELLQLTCTIIDDEAHILGSTTRAIKRIQKSETLELYPMGKFAVVVVKESYKYTQ